MEATNETESISDYEKQANDFFAETNSQIDWEFTGFSDRFNSGSETLEFKYILSRGSRSLEGLFNASIIDTRKALIKDYKYNQFRQGLTLEENQQLYTNKQRLAKDLETLNKIDQKLQLDRKHYPTNTDLYEREIASLKNAKAKLKKLDRKHYPKNYDLLACLTKYDVGDFDNFLSEFGYEIKSAKDYENCKKVYEACKQEYDALLAIYNDQELERLQEIS